MPQPKDGLNARRIDATPRGAPVLANFFVDHAKNAELWDVNGRRYVDFALLLHKR